MRAKIRRGFGRRLGPGEMFPEEVWFDANWVEPERLQVELQHGSLSRIVDAEFVDIRTVADDAWEEIGFPPMQRMDPGQPVPMATPIVECPYGHRRATPRDMVGRGGNLTCDHCQQTYRLGND